MKAQPPCIPCLLSRVLRLAESVTDDVWVHKRILLEIMDFLRRCTFDATPAELMTKVALRASKILGISDPYAERKKLAQEELLAAEVQLRQRLAGSAKPLASAVRFACLANVFEDDVTASVDIADLFANAEKLPLHSDVWEDFLTDIQGPQKNVLFVHSAAGEIVLDKLLLEMLPQDHLVSVVRKNPLLACATYREAQQAALDTVASRIIDPGIDTLGLPVSACSQSLREFCEQADLIIAKGQGAYETLAMEKRTAYVLMRVKCRVVAQALGCEVGDLVLERT